MTWSCCNEAGKSGLRTWNACTAKMPLLIQMLRGGHCRATVEAKEAKILKHTAELWRSSGPQFKKAFQQSLHEISNRTDQSAGLSPQVLPRTLPCKHHTTCLAICHARHSHVIKRQACLQAINVTAWHALCSIWMTSTLRQGNVAHAVSNAQQLEQKLAQRDQTPPQDLAC